ncbi:hypothetical protein [Nonomuraea sp. NPDC050310]|uniref:hypothetical protein n=1 Tax=unclassified Nonomuraea TaxID=2593643 RepID=UPI00340CA8F7
MSEFPSASRTEYPESGSTSGTVDRAKQAASETAHTAAQQARNVGGEIKTQAGQAVGQLRGRLRDQADAQSRRAAEKLRYWADDLNGMTDGAKPDSPVQGVLSQVAGTGHRAADYLEERGLGGAVSDVQDFARRRPAVFLACAAAAGFLFTRIAKAGAKVAQEDQQDSRETLPVVPGTATTTPTTPTTTGYGVTTASPYSSPAAPTTTPAPAEPYPSPRYPEGDVR